MIYVQQIGLENIINKLEILLEEKLAKIALLLAII